MMLHELFSMDIMIISLICNQQEGSSKGMAEREFPD